MIIDKIILGIDPGTTIMGYGLIHVKGKKIELINMGVGGAYPFSGLEPGDIAIAIKEIYHGH